MKADPSVHVQTATSNRNRCQPIKVTHWSGSGCSTLEESKPLRTQNLEQHSKVHERLLQCMS